MKIRKAMMTALVVCGSLGARLPSPAPSAASARTPPAARAPFTVVVLPDSQFLVCRYHGGTPGMFTRQVAWIKEQVAPLNIKAVTHVGDLADCANDPEQWKAVQTAMAGLEERVPFGIAYGNHDCGHFGPDWSLSCNPDWLAEQFRPTFPPSRFAGKPWFGGSYPSGTLDHNFEFFSGGGQDFILLHLGWNPSPEARAWADRVLKQHSRRRAILSTHEYNEDRLSEVGRSIWNDVVRKNDNVFLVLSGHFNSRQKKLVMKNDFGHEVLAIMSDYQVDNPQKAFLRYYTFLPDHRKIQVFTYSTETLSHETGPDSRYDIDDPVR